MTLRLFHDYFIGETTTIGYDYSSWNAATIADLYWLLGESPKRDTAQAVNGSAPPAAPLPLDCPAGWRVPAGAPGAALASDSQAAGADPAGLAWFAICCALIYLIIIGRLCRVAQRPGVTLVFGYALEVLRRCDMLQRGAGGVISAFAGLVLWTVKWGKSQEKPL